MEFEESEGEWDLSLFFAQEGTAGNGPDKSRKRR